MAQITAALITVNTGYVLLAFLPPVLWLVFYMREDQHPEPKWLLLSVFGGGMLAAVGSIVAECLFVELVGGSSCGGGVRYERSMLFIFLGIAAIEEYAKYLVVKLIALRRSDFDEPVDAMIYMMTAAMGFAALENALFVIPLFRENLFVGLEVAAHRFLGANLLHALSSGLVGFFLARAWFRPRRHHWIALGLFIASLLHAGFNYLILVREALPNATAYLVGLLAMMAVMVFIDFERLKKSSPPSQSSSGVVSE